MLVSARLLSHFQKFFPDILRFICEVMGNLLSTTKSNDNCDEDQVVELISKKRKTRDWDADQTYGESSDFVDVKRRKQKTTSQYIYNALFVNGENSDITIRAFDHEWKLHKVYLRQAGFFSGMFHGDWKESSMNEIDLQIPDSKINKEALNIALGSLYSDEIVILPSQVVSVLAAASLIQSEGLMQHCSEVMIENVCCENVYHFYNEARIYGQTDVENVCVKWFENNLMIHASDTRLLQEIDPELMSKIVNSDYVLVLQVEMDLYIMLKKWVYLNLCPDSEDISKPQHCANTIASTFFRNMYKNTGDVFLETVKGRKFKEAFHSIRLCNILRDFGCCLKVEKDGIIPHSWLMPIYRERWLAMLRVEQGIDCGPTESTRLNSDCLRCGRILHRDTDYCWRWNGYNFGLDLLVTFSSQAPRTLLIKRNFESQRRIGSLGRVAHRKINYHIRVFSLNSKGHVIDLFSTGSAFLKLAKDEEKVVLSLYNGDSTKALQFPLLVSASFQVVSNHVLPNENHSISSMGL